MPPKREAEVDAASSSGVRVVASFMIAVRDAVVLVARL